jgi:hypothetical protein
MIKPGKYRHYKGGLYEVIGMAHHSETLEPMVVYKALYHSEGFGDEALWVRPVQMFEEYIMVNGETIQRFSLCEE